MQNANSQLWDHIASQTGFLTQVSNPNPTQKPKGFLLEVSTVGGWLLQTAPGVTSQSKDAGSQRTALKGHHFYNCSEDKH